MRKEMRKEIIREDAIRIIKGVRADFADKGSGTTGILLEAFANHLLALDMAIKSLEVDEEYSLAYEDAKAAGRWIDIHDKMPDYDLDFVLICFDNGFIDVATTDYVMDYEGSNQIVAWMPLPEPYKGAAGCKDN